jgi:L1 cell adhesion molecule like protein
MKHCPFNVISDDGKPKIQIQYKEETKTFTPEEISSIVLRKMKETAEVYLGKTVTSAVITFLPPSIIPRGKPQWMLVKLLA